MTQVCPESQDVSRLTTECRHQLGSSENDEDNENSKIEDSEALMSTVKSLHYYDVK